MCNGHSRVVDTLGRQPAPPRASGMGSVAGNVVRVIHNCFRSGQQVNAIHGCYKQCMTSPFRGSCGGSYVHDMPRSDAAPDMVQHARLSADGVNLPMVCADPTSMAPLPHSRAVAVIGHMRLAGKDGRAEAKVCRQQVGEGRD